MSAILRPALRLAIAAAGLTVALSLPAVAGAVTFGADLSVPADSTSTCDTGGFSPSSCTFFSGAPGPSFFAPQSGTVSQIRVRTGPGPQGPMRVMVLSQLYENKQGDPGHPYTACCFVAAYGPVFTPATDAVSSVTVSLPMVEQPTPPANDYSSVARGDFLALSVLEPGVAIPAASDGQSVYEVFAPAPDPATTPAPSQSPYAPQRSNDGFGFHLMLSADLAPTTGSAPVPPQGGLPPVAVAAAPVVNVRGGRGLTVRRGAVVLPLSCAIKAACRGAVALQSSATARPASRGPGMATRVTYGRAQFSLAAGRRGSVRIVLSAAGRRAVAARRRVPAFANVALGKGHVQTFRITLRR